MNYFLNEALFKSIILSAIEPCTSLGITGHELTTECIKEILRIKGQINDLSKVSYDIKRITHLLASRGMILEEKEEIEDDGTIYYRFTYWPVPKVSDK